MLWLARADPAVLRIIVTHAGLSASASFGPPAGHAQAVHAVIGCFLHIRVAMRAVVEGVARTAPSSTQIKASGDKLEATRTC